MSTTILAIIIVLCLVFITSSLISVTNTLWDILQELKKKEITTIKTFLIMDFRYTRLYRINHKLVVADTLEEAIEIYKSYSGETASDDILSIKAIGDGQIPERYDVLVGVKSSQR